MNKSTEQGGLFLNKKRVRENSMLFVLLYKYFIKRVISGLYNVRGYVVIKRRQHKALNSIRIIHAPIIHKRLFVSIPIEN